MKLKFAFSTLLALLFVVVSMLPLKADAMELAEALAAIKEAEAEMVDVDVEPGVTYVGPTKMKRWPLAIVRYFISDDKDSDTELTTIGVGEETYMIVEFQTWFGNMRYFLMVAWRADRRGPTAPGAAKVFPGGFNPNTVAPPAMNVVPTLIPLWFVFPSPSGVLTMPGTYRIFIKIEGGMPENWEGDHVMFVHLIQNVHRSFSTGYYWQDIGRGYKFTVDSGT